MAKRREIQSRQRVDDEYIASWFKYAPVSKPRPENRRGAVPLQRLSRLAGPRECPWLPGISNSVMRIAILGTRGIPANYGGFETFAEELVHAAGARGHG